MHQGFFFCPTRSKNKSDFRKTSKNDAFFKESNESNMFLPLVGQKKKPLMQKKHTHDKQWDEKRVFHVRER